MNQKDKKKAQQHVDDPRLAKKLAQKAAVLFKKNKGKIGKVKDDLSILIRLVKAWSQKKYTQVRSSTIFWAVATLLYFVNPFDLIPDFLVQVGFLDDITMIGFVVSSLKKELDDFKSWESEQK